MRRLFKSWFSFKVMRRLGSENTVTLRLNDKTLIYIWIHDGARNQRVMEIRVRGKPFTDITTIQEQTLINR